MQLNAEIVAGFSKSLLSANFDESVESPSCHMEWWTLCTSAAPKIAIAAPRRHAKSTAITLAYTLATVLFRERSYVLVVSDTITQAIQFLGEIKKELADNDKLRTLFQINQFEKDTEDDIIVSFQDGIQFRISAKGSEQKLRGLKWNNKRPDLIVGDDLENDEIVLNPERRDKFKRWFYGALVPCLSHSGVIRIVGTILHEDSLLNNLMPLPFSKNTVVEPLKVWSQNKRDSWKSLKYKAHTDDFTTFLWPQRYNREWFLEQRADYIARGLSDVYSQEYLNEPIDETVAFFKKSDFVSETTEDRKKRLNYYISGDLAISKENTADFTVFLIAGMDEERVIHIKNIIRARMDGKEIVETILALNKAYEPVAFGLEDMQVTKSIGPFLNEEMVRSNNFVPLFILKHGGQDKIARAKSIQGRIKARTIRFDKAADWYGTFEDELCKFPRGTKDDQVDAFAYLGRMLDNLIEAPTKQEIEDTLYYDELNASGLNLSGRSQWTGY